MVLPKRVKEGGSYYKGYELIVSSSVGDYVIDMVQTSAAAIASVSVTPDAYGTGDTYTLTHLDSDTTDTRAILAETVYNPGANVTTVFDFPALEQMLPNESFRLTYTNTATTAVNVHIIVEYAGIKKTS